jgi:hypothetical protein
MRETTVTDIERINVIILIIGSLASLAIMRDFIYFFSFAVASSIVIVNFRLLRRIIENFFSRSSLKKKELIIKLPLKFFGVIALVVIVVVWGNINLPFFLIGLSTVFLSLLISQVVAAFSSEPRRKQDGA